MDFPGIAILLFQNDADVVGICTGYIQICLACTIMHVYTTIMAVPGLGPFSTQGERAKVCPNIIG